MRTASSSGTTKIFPSPTAPFSPLRADIERTLRAAPDPRAMLALLELMERVSDQPLYRNNAAALLVDGPATYAAMLEAIANAADHVHLETYIFTDDEVGQRFAQALKSKAEQGVDVRVIFDAIGSVESSGEFFADMERSGVALHAFNDVLEGGDDESQVDTRTHRTLLVVDGAVAFTGGLNIDGVYARSSMASRGDAAAATGWRDTHIEIRGPAVAGFQALFVQAWETAGKGQIDPASLPQPVAKAGDALVRVLGSLGGNDAVSPIRIAYQAAMEAAQEQVLITQSYFAPDDDFLGTIVDAAARGVDVRIVLAGISDSSLLLNASRSHYSRLLEAGARIYESQESILHAKTAVVDGIWSTVGSSNIDSLSFLHNHEVNAVIVDPNLAAELASLFDVDVGHSIEILEGDWARRSLWQRAKEWWSVLFEARL
jgi:cardiolipin synthase